MTGTVAHRSLVDAFAAAAAAHAGRVAIEDGDRTVSYRQLDELATRMAARFTRAGLVQGGRVALLLEPGIDAVAAMLGALRIGAAYVPLDPADPPARIEALLRDAEPGVLVTSSDLVPACRTVAGNRVAVLAAGGDADDPIDAAPPASCLAPGTIAFVMYTSGSTGEPKGVLQTHGNLLHYVEQYASTLRIAPSDRLSMLYSLSFSASSMDVYGALLHGAALCFLNVRRLGVAPLADWIDEKRLTVLHTVPSLFRHLADLAGGAPGRFASVRAIDLGGETVTPSDVDLWRAHFRADCRLVNHLAATEISVIAQFVVPRDGVLEGAVPAGRPAKDVAIAILRADGSHAAPGEPGEIVLSSPYVSPGYWRREALTAAAFSDDPDRPGWRRYRSGDVGVLTADGLLVAMGRRDAVVKVRGHSVHLAEVEAALRRDPAVRDAVVIAGTHADARRGARLVAYVVPGTIDRAALRRRLASRLPRHAIPSAIQPLDALPRTPTGKIDRRALERGTYEQAGPTARRAALTDPVEREIAAIFARLLNVADVDRADDFFELGGDSLLVLALQEELQRAFACEVRAEDLLLDASVAAVGALVRVSGARAPAAAATPSAAPGAARLIALRTSGSGRPLFLVHGGAGRAGASPALLDALGRDQPLYGFQARGYDGAAPPRDAVPDMAAEYLDLLRRVQPRGPYLIGAVCAGAVVAMEMARRLRESGEIVAPLLLIDPPSPHRRRPAVRSLMRRAGLAIAAWLLRARITRHLAAQLLDRRLGGDVAVGATDRDGPGGQAARLLVRVQFSRAAYRHRPRPYDGPIDIVGSRRRLAFLRSGCWDGILTGTVRVFEAGLDHRDVFAPGNAEVMRHLRGSVDDAQRWMAQEAAGDPSRDMREAWDAKWRRSDFVAPWLGRGVPPELERAVSDGWLAPRAAALDIGCGEGDVAAWLAEHGFTAVGIDIAPAAVQRARSRFPEVPGRLAFHALDICAPAAPGWHGRFGVLIDRGCFHQIPAAAIPAYAAGLAALSAPNARLLLFVKAFRTGQSLDDEEERRRVTASVEHALGGAFRIDRVDATHLDPDGGRDPETALPGLVFWMSRLS